ncbi:circadian clock-controlled protein daywake [Leptinotarsa decemlineata]|uniref:circadian clock-controlled protein daywake n=1 Tax=Leptinotarsa decemlineata TaxID=7539 RepID=UPI003D30B0CA
MVSLQYIFFIVSFASVTAITDLPSHFPRCRRTDPNLEQCLLTATETVRPDMIEGVPDLFVSVVNFTVPRIQMEQGTRAVNYKASFENLKLLGLEKYKFTQYRFNVANKSFDIKVDLPYIHLSGQYILEGNILLAPIRGKGIFYVNLTDASCTIFHTVEIYNRNGVEFLRPMITIPKMDVGKVVDYGFTGLFRENKELEKVTKSIISKNLDVIIDEFTPAIEKVLGQMFDDLIFKPLTKIPYEKLYPK